MHRSARPDVLNIVNVFFDQFVHDDSYSSRIMKINRSTLFATKLFPQLFYREIISVDEIYVISALEYLKRLR